MLRAQLQAAIARADTAELQLAALAPSRVGELRQLQHDVQDELNNLRQADAGAACSICWAIFKYVHCYLLMAAGHGKDRV